MSLLRFALSIAILALLADPLAAQERMLRSEPLSDDVYLIASSNVGDPNILAIVGTDGLVLIDGIWSRATDDLFSVVDEISELPIRHAVLTHWHPDHTEGNAALRQTGATVWAHTNAQRRMQSGNPIAYFGVDVPPYPAEALADSTVREPHILHAGEHEIHLIPVAPAHTDGDILVHLPLANVLHVGDLQLAEIYPFVELSSAGDVDGLISALDRALALADENTVVVPGHGPIGKRSGLEEYRTLLATVWGRVKEASAQGSSLEEVQATSPAAEFHDQWSTDLIPTERFVEILYDAARPSGRAGQ